MSDPQATPEPGTATPICFFNTVPALVQDIGAADTATHDLILQGLNRSVRYGPDNKPIYIFYGVENFTGTEPAWDSTPAIFVEDGTHPNMALFSSNPHKALAQVNGRPAGSFAASQVIEAPGQPRLESRLTFTDPEVAALWRKGELGISTALIANTENGALDGKVVPNHVLLFRTGKGKTQPRDLGSMFLNSEPTGGDTVAKLDDILTDFTNSIKNLIPGHAQAGGQGNDPDMDPEAEKKLALANTALQSKDAELKSKAEAEAALKLELENSKKELETFRLAEAEKAWTELKNTTIPPGMVAKEAQEKELRELYNTDKDGFYKKVMNVQKKAPGPGAKGKAQAYTNSDTDGKLEALKETNEAWNRATGVMFSRPPEA